MTNLYKQFSHLFEIDVRIVWELVNHHKINVSQRQFSTVLDSSRYGYSGVDKFFCLQATV